MSLKARKKYEPGEFEILRIADDVNRFSRIHMWFRFLPLEGREYLIFPWKGQQPKNPINQDVSDTDELHWWIWDAAFIDEIPIIGVGKDILMRHGVMLNCFLRGCELNPDGSIFVKGWAVISSRYPRVMDILHRRHDSTLSDEFHGDVNMYYKIEQDAQITNLITAAKNIFTLFQQNCPEWLNATDVHDERRLNRNFSMDSISVSPEIITRNRSNSRADHSDHSDESSHERDERSERDEHEHHHLLHKIASIFKKH